MERHIPAIVEGLKNLAQHGDTETLTKCLKTAIAAKK
jgi:hypothetical protein